MSSWQPLNLNPANNRVGDCVVRAISKALGQDWETTYAELAMYGFMRCDMPNANHVWGAYLKSRDYKQYLIDDKGKSVYTVEDFCKDNPTGTYILAIDGHVVCVVDGKFYDSRNSGKEIPIYYWTKE